MSEPNNKKPFRIEKLSLNNFRGWGKKEDKPFEVDTNANIVLLTGFNGCGKTSILEAINLLINNHCFDLRGDGKQQGDRLNEFIHQGRDYFELEAVLQDFDGGNISIQFQRDKGNLHREDDYWIKEAAPRSLDSATDLLAAATTYFQDRIDTILRDLDRSITLKEWILPLPEEVDYMSDAVERLGDRLENDADSEEKELKQAPNPNPIYIEYAEKFRSSWQKLREDLMRIISDLELPAAPDQLHENHIEFATKLASFANRQTVSKFDSTAFRDIFDAAMRQIKHQIKQYDEQHANAEDDQQQEIRQEIINAQEELASLDKSYPEKTAKLVEAQFTGDIQQDTPGLRQILNSVEKFLEQWHNFSPDLPDKAKLTPIYNELTRLDVGAAAVLRATIEEWENPWIEAQAKRKALRAKIEKLQRQLSHEQTRQSVNTQAVEKALKDWRGEWFKEQQRLKMLDESSKIMEKVKNYRHLAEVIKKELDSPGRLIDRIQPLEGSHKENLNKALDGTLVRFQFDQDFLPVRPQDQSREEKTGEMRQGYELHTQDERPSFMLSTGQRGQVALAYMLAQALMLGKQLPHRILILDDTSTAFDLGNIVRQATWLRQLAYNPEPDRRWQIFVASHHEELTNRLIELLVPPEDAELRLIRFTGWSRETGPLFKGYRSRRNPSCSDEIVRNNFKDYLNRAWSDPPFMKVANG